MARQRCRGCGCLYAAGAPCCPACRATAHDEEAAPAAAEEDEVPKISSTGAVTVGPVTTVHARETLPDGTVSPPVTSDAPAPVAAEPPAPAPAAVTPPVPEPSPVPPAPPAKPAAPAVPAPSAKAAAAPAAPVPAQPKKAANGG